MNKIKDAAERLAEQAAEAEPEAAIQLATACKILTDCFVHMEGVRIHEREVDIHERFHLNEDRLPGEDLGIN